MRALLEGRVGAQMASRRSQIIINEEEKSSAMLEATEHTITVLYCCRRLVIHILYMYICSIIYMSSKARKAEAHQSRRSIHIPPTNASVADQARGASQSS